MMKSNYDQKDETFIKTDIVMYLKGEEMIFYSILSKLFSKE